MREFICSHLVKIINSLGLICDLLGAIFVYRYGLPKAISRTGEWGIMQETTDETEIAKAKLYDHYSIIGIWLLIIGFALQLASNMI